MVKAMCGVQLKDGKRSADLMFMFGLNETTDQLTMANNVCWYSYMLRRQYGHVLRRALNCDVEGLKRKVGR